MNLTALLLKLVRRSLELQRSEGGWVYHQELSARPSRSAPSQLAGSEEKTRLFGNPESLVGARYLLLWSMFCVHAANWSTRLMETWLKR
jgi:hypothetical protein